MNDYTLVKTVVYVICCTVIVFTAGCQGNDNKLFKRGQAAFEKGNFDQAVGIYSQLLKSYPESDQASESLYQLAEIHYRYTKNPEKSIEYYSQLIYSYPDNEHACEARQTLSDIYMEIFHENERAIEEYQKLAVQCPHQPYQDYAQKRIGDCNFKVGNYQQAIIEYEVIDREFETSEFRPEVLKRIGDSSFIRGDMIKAEIYYRKYLRLYPRDTKALEVQISLARVLSAQGQDTMALDLYRELKAQYPHRDDIQSMVTVAEENLHMHKENDPGKN